MKIDMFSIRKEIDRRKEEVRRLKRSMFAKLTIVQKLVIKKVLAEEEVSLQIDSYSECATLSSIGGLTVVCDDAKVRLNHWPHLDYYNDNIPDFYIKEIAKIDNWIKILKRK